MYSAYKLNKQSDNIQPCRTPFPIWNQSVVPCPVLTVASWPAYRFLKKGQVVWYSHFFKNFPQFIVIHTVKGFGIVSKAEIDVFLEFSSFFHDPMDVGNLISGSSAFSKTSLNIWKFSVHTLHSHINNCYHWALQPRRCCFALISLQGKRSKQRRAGKYVITGSVETRNPWFTAPASFCGRNAANYGQLRAATWRHQSARGKPGAGSRRDLLMETQRH